MCCFICAVIAGCSQTPPTVMPAWVWMIYENPFNETFTPYVGVFLIEFWMPSAFSSTHTQEFSLNRQMSRLTVEWQPGEETLGTLYVTSSNDVSDQTEQSTLTAEWWFSKCDARAICSHSFPPQSFNDKWRKRVRRVVQGKRCVFKMTKGELKTWWLDALDSFQVHFNDWSMATPTSGEQRQSQREFKKIARWWLVKMWCMQREQGNSEWKNWDGERKQDVR